MKFHKEGNLILLISFLILAGINVAVLLLVDLPWLHYLLITAAVIVYGLIVQFFRNPTRTSPTNPNYILAPADGKVVVIEETTEQEYLKDARRQVSIFMSPLNVHVNRNPVSGEVTYTQYHPGKYLVAWHPKSSTENERNTLVIKAKNGVEVLFRQIAGAMARRIKWYVKPGDEVVSGQEFGFIRFGSRVDVFLPLDAEIKVKIGDKTRGGETILAEFKR
ncbi:MAG TPA: phosphatidylserine decarboxylase family protein [Microscillaceae bacterium]|nr:phosphatidylserine decarboxylase family protein [Microscillaceae bacterium]